MNVIVRESWRGVWRRSARSGLVVLTLALSFSVVLVVIGVIEGGRRSIRDSLFSLGVDVIAALNPIRIEGLPFLRLGRGGSRLIDREAIDELKVDVADLARVVVPTRIELSATERDDGISFQNTLFVTTPGYFAAVPIGLFAGRYLDENDRFVPGGDVNVVFDRALAHYYEPDDPARVVGAAFDGYRSGKRFRAHVVGVLNDPIVLRRHMKMLDTQRKARDVQLRRLEFLNAYVLYDPAKDEPSGVIVQANTVDDVSPLSVRMHEFFEERGIEPYYLVQRDWIGTVLRAVNEFSFLLHFLWVVTLFVALILCGSIGYMAVEERFPEIAVLRVEGARVGDVVGALLLEGVLLSIVSVPIGLAVAQLAFGSAVRELLWEPYVPPLAYWGTPILLMLVGLLAFAWPAARVARLDPAVALGEYRE
ncbi:MAG: ABC transporter permease [Planctomycetes bacterium]|nr:ABC transporter permease [Planctomycetota bacterium]